MKLLKKWKKELGISHWDISTERIDPKQVMYGDEKYFIGITIDWDNLSGVIYHDIDLEEESIVHELLHIKYSTEKEDWINKKTKELIKQK